MKSALAIKILVAATVIFGIGAYAVGRKAEETQLPTGRRITPVGTQLEVGSFPVNMAASLDNKFLFVTNSGYREFLTSIRVSDGKVISKIPVPVGKGKSPEGLYFGLSVLPDGTLAVSRGAEDRVAIYNVSRTGEIDPNPKFVADPFVGTGTSLKNNCAGIATDSTGSTLYVANNETGVETNMKGSLSVVDLRSGNVTARVTTGGFPYAVASITNGNKKDRKVYVSSERDSLLNVFDPKKPGSVSTVKVGASPIGLTLDKSQKHLYAANASSDTISVINTDNDRVEKTILLRPDDVRDLPGCTPTASALSTDESRLYVTLADMNAVAVVDLKEGRTIGYIGVGWYPTAIWVSPETGKIFVANAKGVQSRNPNKVKGEHGTYIQNIIEGTVSVFDTPTDAALSEMTLDVLTDSRVAAVRVKADDILQNPGIKHVIYIIKENRTYDQVFGDVPTGNGDPSLTLFGKQITPNQHALAERFALLDNFYDCSEVSADGWSWSTSGMVGQHTARNAPYNYSGRGRVYDFEGQNNGVPVDLLNIPDVAKAPGAYIWDNVMTHGKGLRNYGFFVSFADPGTRQKAGDKTTAKENMPNKKSLIGKTDLDYRLFDGDYPDSDAYAAHGLTYPKRLKEYGKHHAPSRFAEWKQEFTGYVKHNNMPDFMMLRLGNDHTDGTSVGSPAPQSMVADNDYAVGQLVEAVSHSPYWKSTAVFVLEDDAQGGNDHVDAHRSTAFVISPFVHRGTIDHRFFNTDSTLRTMEILLGLPPMNQYDAAASVYKFFDRQADNIEPYSALLPDRSVLAKTNGTASYKSDVSNKMNFKTADSVPAELLNDIVWHSIKGSSVPVPATPHRHAVSSRKDADD
ncbi:MAG: alkaline phosphatase family protein [Chthonomonadales bacterium]